MIHSTKRDSYWSFWCQGWSNHQDQEVFWRNRTVEAVETTEVAEADEINVAAKVSKAWKITTEDFRVIQVLEFSFILIVWKKRSLVITWNIRLNFGTFLSEAVEASLCYFFENWLIKLKCPNLLKPLGTIIHQNSQFYYPSEPFSFHHFNVRHPVSI